jgi:hypothetical protein
VELFAFRPVCPKAILGFLSLIEWRPGASGIRKWPERSLVNAATPPAAPATTKAKFASGAEADSPERMGPPWVGPIEITPSIPVAMGEVCAFNCPGTNEKNNERPANPQSFSPANLFNIGTDY